MDQPDLPTPEKLSSSPAAPPALIREAQVPPVSRRRIAGASAAIGAACGAIAIATVAALFLPRDASRPAAPPPAPRSFATPPVVAEPVRPLMEVVFVLDTTG